MIIFGLFLLLIFLLALLSLAILCWLVAEHVTGGNGFIAAFVGGMFVKVHFENAGEHMLEFAEAWGQLLNFGVFFIFWIMTPWKAKIRWPYTDQTRRSTSSARAVLRTAPI